MDRPTALLFAVALTLASTAALAPVVTTAAGEGTAAADAPAQAPGRASPGAMVDGVGPTQPVGSVSPTGPAAGAALTPPVPTENSTARLALPVDRIERTGFAVVGFDMGNTLQAGTDDARGRHYHIVVQQRLADADNTSERATAVDRSLIEMRERVRDLEARERAALTAHNDGRISTETLLERLALLHVEANRLGDAIESLKSVTQPDSELSYLRPGILSLEARVEILQGPVRGRVARTLAGQADPIRIYAETAGDGVVLSMLTGETYVREATLYENRNPGDGTIDNAEAFERIQELYPWTFENAFSTSLQGFGREAYRIALPHPQGRLVAYMDGDTEDIYREVQRLTVPSMPAVDTFERERDQARVVFERTYAGGPLTIRVENPTTGGAIDAQVRVNGHAVGQTGFDGTVTIVQPRPPYDVTVATEQWTYNLTVEEPRDEQLPD